jgi:hypothetical protein
MSCSAYVRRTEKFWWEYMERKYFGMPNPTSKDPDNLLTHNVTHSPYKNTNPAF